jgi:hypothetical protein
MLLGAGNRFFYLIMWGFLTEFWGAITEVVVGGATYTVSFFQSIGNAVAGAVMGAFDWFLHFGFDTYTFIRWVADSFSQLFVFLTSPLSYFYQFLKAFFLNITKPPIEIAGGITQYATSTQSIFQAIPYWDTMTLILGIGLLLAGAIGLVALFLKIY